ncbi:TPA: hypothetical protein LC346_004720 [Salmonella enterica subsp. enterica serovar Kintambo]|nr:hypothetical protein [Salmonella enterica subsp. enterica serovar Kintambo]
MSKSDKDKALIKVIKNVVIDTSVSIADTMTGGSVSIIKKIAEHTNDFYNEINKQKLYDFYMGIYVLDDKSEKKSSKANLAFLIKKFVQDDEASKTKLYSKLAINIAKSILSDDERIDFISTLSNLTSYDINFMRKVYVYDNFKIKSIKNKDEQLLNISETRDGRQIKSLNKLYSNGLIFEPNRGKAAHQYYKPTNYLCEFIKLIFDKHELTPDAIDEIEKNKADIFFRSNHEYISNKDLYDEKIITPLKELGCSVIINTDEYGPYNDNADIYIAIDNDTPFIKNDDSEQYLSLIIEKNEQIFFGNNHAPTTRYNILASYIFDDSDSKKQSVLSIRKSLKGHIKSVASIF